jgi:hypothetical protein
MLRFLYRAFWEDLGLEEPHPARALLYVLAAGLLSICIWAGLIGFLLVAAGLR